jgi:DNA replication protein DnaC
MEKIEKPDYRNAIEQLRQKMTGVQQDPAVVGELDRQRQEKERREWLEALEKSGIEKRYRDCTFDAMTSRGIPDQVEQEFKMVQQYAANIADNVKHGYGLAMLGPVGVMKTSMAVAAIQAGLKQGISGMFITMPSLLDTIFTLKDTSKEELVRFEDRLRNVGILLLDDLGAEHTEGWVHTKIDAIVSERYNRSQLEKTYAARIYDRIKSTSDLILFAGKSLRTARGA